MGKFSKLFIVLEKILFGDVSLSEVEGGIPTDRKGVSVTIEGGRFIA